MSEPANRQPTPDERLDAEGLPVLEGQPPGIDIETEQEGLIAPRDYPIAAGDDPAYPTTDAGQRTPEPVSERAEREQPDAGADELGVGGGVQGAGHWPRLADRSDEDTSGDGGGEDTDEDTSSEDEGEDEGAWALDRSSATEAVRRSDGRRAGPDRDEEIAVMAETRLVGLFGADEVGTGERAPLAAAEAEVEDESASAEEVAMHIEEQR